MKDLRFKTMIQIGLAITSLMTARCMAGVIPETKLVKLGRATNEFGFELLRSFAHDRNVFISPFSISMVLAMAYLGAEGTTVQTMRKALNYDKFGLSDQDVQEAFMSALTQTVANKDEYQLSTYNGALVQKETTVLDSYEQALKYYYSADIRSVDFGRQPFQIKTDINNDVEQATHGKITNFLQKPPSFDTKLLLLNAVYFLGNWNKPFNPENTREEVFYNHGFQKSYVQMMKRHGNYVCSFRNELNATVVVMPYLGENSASMIIILPNERTGVEKLQQKITQESLDNALSKSDYASVHLSLPKFSLSYSENLEQPLSRLGLKEIFDDDANFSRIAGDENTLSVSGVYHKAAIEVNEKGSEASSATDLEFTYRSRPSNIIVNHPFLFFIMDNRNGMILFSGKVDEL